MDINKKSAPQHDVIEIIKTGRWGSYEYIHRLACGHAEIRKRAEKSKKLACEKCVKAGAAVDLLASLSQQANTYLDFAEIHDEIAISIASVEQDIGRTRAALAKRLGVTPDAVDIVMDETSDVPQIVQAVVYLETSEIGALLEP